MGNFLENLVVRNLQPAASEATRLLQPRLPSLFESPGGADDSIAAPHTEESVKAKTEARESESGRGDSRVSEKNIPSTIRVEPQRTILEHVDAEPTASVRPGIEPSRKLEHGETQSKLQVEENPIHEIKARVNLLSDERESKKVEESLSSIERGVLPQIEVVKAKPESKPILAPLPISTSAQVQESKLESTAAQESVIHIHIGRIDVRTVTPSQNPVARSVPQKPRLTLDDYLRQRDEGKR